jgi:hypothetical protein
MLGAERVVTACPLGVQKVIVSCSVGLVCIAIFPVGSMLRSGLIGSW